MPIDEPYEEIIEAERAWFSFDWRELLRYRDLLLAFAWRDMLLKFRELSLGPAWFFVQPLSTAFIFSIIFNRLAQISTDGVPSILFYLSGLLFWTYFSQGLSSVSRVFSGHSDLFKKVHFPRLIAPLSLILSNLITFFIQAALFILIYLYFKFWVPSAGQLSPSFFCVWLPALILQTSALALGCGLWFSVLTSRNTDMQGIINFLLQLWMYATPVIYPTSMVPAKWRFLQSLNPMSSIIEGSRYAFFGVGVIHFGHFIVSGLITALILITGVLVFNKFERNFLDES